MPYWRLSLFYFFYFATLGAFIAYWGLYLKSKGISDFTIGSLLAVFIAPRIFSPMLLAWVADKTQKMVLILKISAFLMLLSFIGLIYSENLAYSFFWIFCFGFFFSGILPKFEALTFSYILKESHKYTLIRLWGSIGFALAVLLIGWTLEQTSIAVLLQILAILVLGIVLISYSLQELNLPSAANVSESFLDILLSPQVKFLLLVAFLVQLSHGAYYSFFSIYLQEYSYSKSTIGLLWAIGVLAEILLFFYLSKFNPVISKHNLIMLALLLTVLRWVLTALFVENVIWLAVVQLLHAASFALFHAMAVQYINSIFVMNMRARGQALYSMASFGAGGMLGSLLAGLGWDYIGGTAVFALSALIALAAAALWQLGAKTAKSNDI